MTIFGPPKERDRREACEDYAAEQRLDRDLSKHLWNIREQRQEILRLAQNNVILSNIFQLWRSGGVSWERAVNEAIKALLSQNNDLLLTAQKKFMLQPAAVVAFRCPQCGYLPATCEIPGVQPAPVPPAEQAGSEIVCLGRIPGISDQEEEGCNH